MRESILWVQWRWSALPAIICLVVGFALLAVSGPAWAYEKTYFGTAITVDANGHVYVAGGGWLTNNSGEFFLLKYDAATGTRLWARTYPASPNHIPTKAFVALDQGGNIFVAGEDYSGPSNNILLLKYDPAGNLLWPKTISGSPNGLAVDGNGNPVVTGYGAGTVKFSSATGVVKWAKPFAGEAIKIDAANNNYVAVSEAGGKCTLVKYGPLGAQLWVRRYGSDSQACSPVALALDTAGQIYVAGRRWTDAQVLDYLTLKYDAAGVRLWAKTYHQTAGVQDRAVALGVDTGGNAYVTGSLSDYEKFGTIKYDSTGAFAWVRTYSYQSAHQHPRSLAVDASNNVIVTGQSNNDTDADAVAIKYDSAGTRLWVRRYNGGYDDVFAAVTTDASGNVYVTGETWQEIGTSKALTIKYDANGTKKWARGYLP